MRMRFSVHTVSANSPIKYTRSRSVRWQLLHIDGPEHGVQTPEGIVLAFSSWDIAVARGLQWISNEIGDGDWTVERIFRHQAPVAECPTRVGGGTRRNCAETVGRPEYIAQI